MTFSLGMMQTTANEGEAREEESKGTGASVCVRVCVCLWNIRSGCLSHAGGSRAAILPLGGASFSISYSEL